MDLIDKSVVKLFICQLSVEICNRFCHSYLFYLNPQFTFFYTNPLYESAIVLFTLKSSDMIYNQPYDIIIPKKNLQLILSLTNFFQKSKIKCIIPNRFFSIISNQFPNLKIFNELIVVNIRTDLGLY